MMVDSLLQLAQIATARGDYSAAIDDLKRAKHTAKHHAKEFASERSHANVAMVHQQLQVAEAMRAAGTAAPPVLRLVRAVVFAPGYEEIFALIKEVGIPLPGRPPSKANSGQGQGRG